MSAKQHATNIDEALAAIATVIQSSTGLAVRVARPAETATGLVVWPWRVVDVAALQNNTSTHRATGMFTRPPVVVQVSFLLLASPAGSDASPNQLLLAHRALLDNPVVGESRGNFRVVAQPLSIEDLAAVFTSAQLRLSLCTNYSLQLAL